MDFFDPNSSLDFELSQRNQLNQVQIPSKIWKSIESDQKDQESPYILTFSIKIDIFDIIQPLIF